MGKTAEDGWITVGEIGVDTARVLICDPGNLYKIYDSGRDDSNDAAVHDGVAQLAYDHGGAGLCVEMFSGYGDGTYPVQIKRNGEGRISEMRAVFIAED
jgi:hypothetical protein